MCALHLYSVISTPTLGLRKLTLTLVPELKSHELPNFQTVGLKNDVNTWRALLMITYASVWGCSFIPYQCQVEIGLIVQFLDLWLTAYCRFA